MPFKKHVQRISTIFSDEEFKKIKEWAMKHGYSMYRLAQEAIRDFIKKRS